MAHHRGELKEQPIFAEISMPLVQNIHQVTCMTDGTDPELSTII